MNDKQKMILKLKMNTQPLMQLNAFERLFMQGNITHLQRLVPSGHWHPMHCDNLKMGRVYRLRPDFELPEEPKETVRYFYDITMHEFHAVLSLYGNPATPVYFKGRSKCIEITPEQKDYLENKPEAVEGFEWVLKEMDKGDYVTSSRGLQFRIKTLPKPASTYSLKGIRWVRVPVEVKPDIAELVVEYVKARKALVEARESVLRSVCK